MNRRDLDKFESIDELWEQELEEFGLFYQDDMAEDIKNK